MNYKTARFFAEYSDDGGSYVWTRETLRDFQSRIGIKRNGSHGEGRSGVGMDGMHGGGYGTLEYLNSVVGLCHEHKREQPRAPTRDI